MQIKVRLDSRPIQRWARLFSNKIYSVPRA